MAQGFISLLRRNPRYRALYLGRTISLLGDWLNTLALLALLREIGANSASAMGAIFILKLLPAFVAGPFVGIVNDRYNRTGIMIRSDLVRFLFVMGYFAVPLIPSAGTLYVFYALVVAQALGSAFFEPAYSSTIPNLVSRSDLAAANALSAVTWSLIFAVGAGIGGVITEWLGWRMALAVDAVSYLVSAAMIAKIGAWTPPSRKQGETGSAMEAFQGLYRLLRREREILYSTLIKAAWCTGGALQLALPLFGERVYHLDGRPNLGTALLFMTRAFGTAAGPVLARRYVDSMDRPLVYRTIWLSFLVAGGFYLLFGFIHHLWVALACLFIAHMGGSVIWVYSTVLLQQLVPDAYRGRIFSTENGMAVLMICLMNFFSGWLIDNGWVDLWFLPRSIGAVVLLAGLVFWLVGKPMVRELESKRQN